MTKLGELFTPNQYATLDALRHGTRVSEREAKRMREIETLARTQNEEPAPMTEAFEEELRDRLATHFMQHQWVAGDSVRHSMSPEAVFTQYRAGKTSKQWQTYLERTEIDPPKRER